jgi:hypothetical protein
MIKEFYAIQKFQKISEALDLDLELLESKQKTGILHIITKKNISGGYNVLKSFKNFDEIEQFLKSFKLKFKTLLEEDIKKLSETSNDYKPTPTKKRPLASNRTKL